MDQQFLTGARIFTGDRWLDDHGILIRDGLIAALIPDGRHRGEAEARTIPLPQGTVLAPGFLDVQVNGGGGVLFNDTPTVAGALAIAAAHRRFGTTALLPTFITGDPAAMRLAADAAAAAAEIPGSGIAGLHLEGPFLNPVRRGVHEAAFVRELEADDIDYLCSLPARFPAGKVLLTLAPERVGTADLARLAASGIVLAGGHSAATYEQTEDAVAAGLRGFTHLFNAMPPITNREPGIALAALTYPATWCGIIADGIHVHPALLRAALALKPRGRVFLVTDAMPPTGTSNDSFMLDGRTIFRRDGRLVTADGVLAGADLDMATAVARAMSLLGQPLEEALRMASTYPTEFLGLKGRHGRIALDHPADLVLLRPEGMRVLATWVGGVRHCAEDGPDGGTNGAAGD